MALVRKPSVVNVPSNKRRIIKENEFVRIEKDFDPPEEAVDSSDFDVVSRDEILSKFQSSYEEHIKVVIGMMTSRMSLDTALQNAVTNINDASPSTMVPIDGKVSNKIDDIFTEALLLYAREKAFSFVLDEKRRTPLLQAAVTQPVIEEQEKKALSRTKQLLGKVVSRRAKDDKVSSKGTTPAQDSINEIDRQLQDMIQNEKLSDNADPFGAVERLPRGGRSSR